MLVLCCFLLLGWRGGHCVELLLVVVGHCIELLLVVVRCHCIDLLLVVVSWWLCSALACIVEKFSTPCVAAFDCFAMFFEVSIRSIRVTECA